ncbi:MAG: ABC transporter permease [Lentisphaeria bacterium]|nr:ABC transporter permease [Lentisphaeria bacterium]
MLRLITRRLLQAVPVLFVISVLSFLLVRLAPGDPFSQDREIPEEIRARLEACYGLDRPLWVQYLHHMRHLFTGDLPSFRHPGRTVQETIGEKFPVSLELGLYALLVAVTVGIPAGVLAAVRRNTAWDHLPMAAAMTGICLPTFVLGPLLILVFAMQLRWFHATGWDSPSDRVLPALTLGLYYAAYVARLARAGMLEVLSQEFIRTARAKGLPEWLVVVRHGLRGGLVPVVTFLGPACAGLITGSFAVEKIFFIPGLGQDFVAAAFNRDYTLVLGTVMFYAILIVALNLVVDVLHQLLDPRSRDAASAETSPA